jgi:hypothetical protein
MAKNFKTRIQNKHGLEVDWLKATSFVPLQGEVIVYDIEVDGGGNVLSRAIDGESVPLLPEGRAIPYTYERIKVGDGISLVNDLPFITETLDSDIRDIKSQLADLMYEAITISSFSHNVPTQERGAVVTEVTLSWATNKTPNKIMLDGEVLDNNTKSKIISDVDITWDNNKVWQLDVIDERSATARKTVAVDFCNNIYYGTGAVESGFTNDFITGLTKRLQSAKAYDFTVTSNAQYLYYALPKRLGTVTFKVGGFEGGFKNPEVVSVTNSSGYTEDYYVYRSTNTLNGSITVDVT